MCMQINLGRLDALVTEPQRDHRCIDPCLQEPHRRRVSQNMGSHPLAVQRRTFARGDAGVFGQEALDRIAAQASAVQASDKGSWASPRRSRSQTRSTAAVCTVSA